MILIVSVCIELSHIPGVTPHRLRGRFSSSSDCWEPKPNIYITELSKNMPADQWPGRFFERHQGDHCRSGEIAKSRSLNSAPGSVCVTEFFSASGFHL